jgi:hypothetical protein
MERSTHSFVSVSVSGDAHELAVAVAFASSSMCAGVLDVSDAPN